MAPHVFCDSNGGNRIQMASLDRDIESAVGFCTLKRMRFAASDVTACWPASRRISMMTIFQLDVQLTACHKNNLTGTGRCKARATRATDSSAIFKFFCD